MYLAQINITESITLIVNKCASQLIGSNLQTVEVVECAHIVEVPLELRQIELLTESEHTAVLALGLCLKTPCPTGVQLAIKEATIPIDDIGKRIL